MLELFFTRYIILGESNAGINLYFIIGEAKECAEGAGINAGINAWINTWINTWINAWINMHELMANAGAPGARWRGLQEARRAGPARRPGMRAPTGGPLLGGPGL